MRRFSQKKTFLQKPHRQDTTGTPPRHKHHYRHTTKVPPRHQRPPTTTKTQLRELRELRDQDTNRMNTNSAVALGTEVQVKSHVARQHCWKQLARPAPRARNIWCPGGVGFIMYIWLYLDLSLRGFLFGTWFFGGSNGFWMKDLTLLHCQLFAPTDAGVNWTGLDSCCTFVFVSFADFCRLRCFEVLTMGRVAFECTAV